MRVVFDVNILIRAVLGSPSVARLLVQSVQAEATVLTSDLLLCEFAACSRKPRLASLVQWPLYNETLAFLTACGEPVTLTPPFPACRDPDDAYLLAMCQEGKADYLVTLDRDLLDLRRFGLCQITTPQEFATRLTGG